MQEAQSAAHGTVAAAEAVYVNVNGRSNAAFTDTRHSAQLIACHHGLRSFIPF